MLDARRVRWSAPWALALVGLAVPMAGSGFVGWPFVAGWLVVLLAVWWVRPLGGATRGTRLAAGAFAIGGLVLLATLGGLYLVPAVIVWLGLVAEEAERPRAAGPPLPEQPPG